MKFKKIKIDNWKQFEEINIDFHPNLTILTGANGSGKTTILNLLAKHFGWHINELATPKKEKGGGFRFHIGVYNKKAYSTNNPMLHNPGIHNPGMHNPMGHNSKQYEIGRIIYEDNSSNSFIATEQDNAVYNIQIQNMKAFRGVNIPSHRPVFFYEQVPSVPTKKITKEFVSNQINQSKVGKYNSNFNNTKATNYYIKETLLNWAIGGGGNKFITADLELENYFNGFEEVLQKTLPKSLGFLKISIRNYEIVFETKTGDFMLDAASGGISAIIDLVWSIYINTLNTEQSIVLIDEIENHLHATLQRAILPSLINAFSNVQFITSTHSPLIIGSVKDSNVYALRYNVNNKIYNEKLDLINKAKNANEILNEVLGVPFSMPIWVENELENIINKYSEQEISSDIFKNMRRELDEKGLENLMPWAMDKTLDRLDDKDK